MSCVFSSKGSVWYFGVLGAVLAGMIVWSGIGAHYVADWFLENGLVLGLVIAAVAWRRRLGMFSVASWTMVWVFLCVHELGAHWTYSEVPYREWWAALTGGEVPAEGWSGRNYFDRMVHFMYGFLFYLPMREWFVATAGARGGFWAWFVPVNLVASTSMIYELIEWWGAEAFGGELGMAYLGTQGDVWDAHKDMALATLGAMVIAGGLGMWRRRVEVPVREGCDTIYH